MAMTGGCTWNTVRQDCGKVSKWDLDPELSENFPPKICIPNREKIKMKRKRITSRELMDEMELTSDLTKLPIEAQYLENGIRLLAAVMDSAARAVAGETCFWIFARKLASFQISRANVSIGGTGTFFGRRRRNSKKPRRLKFRSARIFFSLKKNSLGKKKLWMIISSFSSSYSTWQQRQQRRK